MADNATKVREKGRLPQSGCPINKVSLKCRRTAFRAPLDLLHSSINPLVHAGLRQNDGIFLSTKSVYRVFYHEASFSVESSQMHVVESENQHILRKNLLILLKSRIKTDG